MSFFKNRDEDSFFCDINGKKLDKYQRKVIVDDNNRLLVVAGAGSGKTLTIIGKIKYLIEKKGLKEQDILCLSFTNETVNNLKNKLNYNVDVFTFHKLALNIIRDNNYTFSICHDSFLDYLVDEYFYMNYDDLKKYLFIYFEKKIDYNDLKLNSLKINLLSFINKIKADNKNILELKKIRKKIKKKKDKVFYYFVISILKMYYEELESVGMIDFDNMIKLSTYLVEKNGMKRKYQYIIIDEYQDISFIRFQLIKSILQRCNAKLMCVGDDYQSIYGFSGSNIHLFLDFFMYFPDGKRIDIKNIYRNSFQLINIASHFIMKNKKQLKKALYANFLLKYPVVLIYYDNDYLEKYHHLMDYLYLENKKDILVLGRYQSDIDCVYEENNANIKYLTIHKAKGLEADNVILLKASNEYKGFPSNIQNDSVFSLIDHNDEIEYAEERRLFYVALTRTREKIYILVSRNNPSIFIEEIKSKCVELLFK